MKAAVVLAITLLFATVIGACAGEPASAVTDRRAEFFETRVRPVLVENCFTCHGPKKQKSGLRLDSRDSLLKGSDNGAVVVPGNPDGSALIRAIRYGGELKMPPRGKLNPEAIDALTSWVKMGVPWPEIKATSTARQTADLTQRHWAFQAVKDPPLPTVKDFRWTQSSIDRFILAKLERKGLAPSSLADRRTLIRRATFDLLGLPPTPEEVAAFEADRSGDAFASLVDRLLASPHYGERWGRYWLDVARYADTKGYVFFEEGNYPWAYTYRDYVIHAFNRDLPYDQFIIQQLAADRLPLGTDKHPLTALGFLTVGGHFMNNLQDIVDDRIDVVTRGLLGLTVTCARCHDHKFDPIPSKDYYSLYGIFASCSEPAVPPLFADPPDTPSYRTFAKELRSREEKLTQFVQRKHDELVQSSRRRVAEYMLAAHALEGRPSTEDFMLIADGGDLNPRMLHRWQAYLERTSRSHDPVFAPWHALAALPEKMFAEKARALASRLVSHPDSARPINPLVVRALAGNPPQTLAAVARRYGELLNGADKLWQEALKRPADSRAPMPRSLSDPAQEQLRQVFYGPHSPPNVAMNPVGDLDLLPDRASQAKLQELRKAVETWRATGPGAPPRAMVLEDLPTPYEPRVFVRGNPNNLGAVVPRRFLSVLAGEKRAAFREGSGRLELARTIVAPDNPLTARVMVNRIWLHHFGTGLVRTPSDFGLRSEAPTHPELLDHLAKAFMENGWSIKKMHRLIMLSAAYQQKSDDRPECRKIDPENTLLWKMNRRRLDFEATRDTLLASAGILDETVGGPAMFDLTASSARRRTVYGFIDRLNLPGLFRTFDFPSPDATSPQREITTIPQQALFMMNNHFVIEAAQKLMQRPEILAEHDSSKRVVLLYHRLYSRNPTGEELAMAHEFLGAAHESAKAWEQYAQGLMLANECVFVD
jgi:hypothetical protein